MIQFYCTNLTLRNSVASSSLRAAGTKFRGCYVCGLSCLDWCLFTKKSKPAKFLNFTAFTWFMLCCCITLGVFDDLSLSSLQTRIEAFDFPWCWFVESLRLLLVTSIHVCLCRLFFKMAFCCTMHCHRTVVICSGLSLIVPCWAVLEASLIRFSMVRPPSWKILK